LNWTVKLSSKADKYLQKLDKNKRTQFKKELMALSEYGIHR